MKLRPIAGIVLRQIYLLRGSPVRVFPMVTWVAIDIVLWGFITRYLNNVSGGGMDFVPTLLGRRAAMGFLHPHHARSQHGISRGRLVAQFPESVCLAPVDLRIHHWAGDHQRDDQQCRGGRDVELATGVFHLQFFAMGLPLIAFLLVLFVFGITLGIFASGIVLRLGPASEWLLWPLPALLSPFAAVFYPLAVLPHWMQWVARCAAALLRVRGHAHACWPIDRFPAVLLLQGSGVAVD